MAIVIKKRLICDRCGHEGEFDNDVPPKHWGKVHAVDGFAPIIGAGDTTNSGYADWCPKCMGDLRAIIERKSDA